MLSNSFASSVNHCFLCWFVSNFFSDVDKATTIRVAWACIKTNRIPHCNRCKSESDDDDDAADDAAVDAVNKSNGSDGRGTSSEVDDFSTSAWMESPIGETGACSMRILGWYSSHRSSSSPDSFCEVVYILVMIVFSDPFGPLNVASRSQCRYFNCDSFRRVSCSILYPTSKSSIVSSLSGPVLAWFSFETPGIAFGVNVALFSLINAPPWFTIKKNVDANSINESTNNSSDHRNIDLVFISITSFGSNS